VRAVRLLLALVLLLAAGCAAPPAADPLERAEVRTDPAPITSRFPALGAPLAVTWIGGTLGDDRVPGPSRFFLEAVVALAPADVERLRATHAAVAGGPPAVPGPLRAAAGERAWTELAGVPGPAQWSTRVWLAADVAYVSARGE
jgi:hypothetical protein